MFEKKPKKIKIKRMTCMRQIEPTDKADICLVARTE